MNTVIWYSFEVHSNKLSCTYHSETKIAEDYPSSTTIAITVDEIVDSAKLSDNSYLKEAASRLTSKLEKAYKFIEKRPDIFIQLTPIKVTDLRKEIK